MRYYNTCQNCGANLDPGEVCECKAKLTKQEIIAEITELAKKMTDEQIEKFIELLETNGFKAYMDDYRFRTGVSL